MCWSSWCNWRSSPGRNNTWSHNSTTQPPAATSPAPKIWSNLQPNKENSHLPTTTLSQYLPSTFPSFYSAFTSTTASCSTVMTLGWTLKRKLLSVISGRLRIFFWKIHSLTIFSRFMWSRSNANSKTNRIIHSWKAKSHTNLISPFRLLYKNPFPSSPPSSNPSYWSSSSAPCNSTSVSTNAALSLSPTKTSKKESTISNSSTTPPKINLPLCFKKSYSPKNPTISKSNSLKSSLSSKTLHQKLMTWPQVGASLICSRHQSKPPSESPLLKRTKYKNLITSISVNP